ncbi:hypothetical protein SO802_001829 [Lithocarpus litseifolius]|uniref:Uncharacterized protein n=1 Tax=Lithocarpus litseifolius TaxID=425828 RepID=A0AAW2DVH2_9ROSI
MSLFLDSWVYISKLEKLITKNNTTLLPELTPFFDRTVVKYPATLDSMFSNRLLAINSRRSLKSFNFEVPADIVRATFELSCTDIENIRKRVLSWGDKNANFRSRLDPPIPANYFGNCVRVGGIGAEARELMEESGLAIAAYRIIDGIKKMKGFLNEADKLIEMVTREKEVEGTQTQPEVISIAWSNKFRDYEKDFGWGRPKKVELTNIYRTKATSMVDSKNGNGGVEVGMVLKNHEMDRFASLFVTGLQSL